MDDNHQHPDVVWEFSVLKRLVPVGRASSHDDGFRGLGHRHLAAFPGQVLDTGGDVQSAATMLFRVGHRGGVRAVCDLLKNRMDTHTHTRVKRGIVTVVLRFRR